MSHDPSAEHERVRAKYALTRPSDVVLYVLAVVLLAIVSLFVRSTGSSSLASLSPSRRGN